jgi:hypothetical protein
MIDFISATTSFESKDNLFLPHLQFEAKYSSGWEKYYLNGCEKMEVWINSNRQILKLRGSVSYYWQGHNFTFTNKEFVAAINHIKGLLNINIWNAMLDVFEFGVIMEVQDKPKEYILHHSALPKDKLTMNEKPKDKHQFRWWNDSNVSLKMYDASRNIQMKQGENRKEIIRQAGWQDSGDFLKWEAHYLKPQCLNKGKGLKLYNLVNPDWNNVFKEDLYLQYKRLVPMKSIITPQNKKDLSTADILALTFAEEAINEGQSLEDLKKILYAKVNSTPDDVLSKADKDARKRQLKGLLDKLKESPESKWDLSDKIQEALDNI